MRVESCQIVQLDVRMNYSNKNTNFIEYLIVLTYSPELNLI